MPNYIRDGVKRYNKKDFWRKNSPLEGWQAEPDGVFCGIVD